MKKRLEKFDRPIIGVILGITLPIIGFLISYPVLARGVDMDFERYVSYAKMGANRQNILVFCMLPNMFLFYLTNFRWRMNELTKGLVAVTLILGVILVVLTLT